MKAIFAIIALLCLVDSQACEINLPGRLLVSGLHGERWPFGAKECSFEQVSNFHELIDSQSGKVAVGRLQAAAGVEAKIVTKAETVQIQRLEDLIKETFPESSEREMELNGATQSDIIALAADSEVKLKCHPCLFNGDETIRVDVKNYTTVRQEYSFTAHFRQMVLAPRIRSTVTAFSTLSASQLEMVKVPQSPFVKYVTDLSRINFFKTNKTLRTGEILKESDLTPLSLIRAGDKVEMSLESGSLNIKAHAVSRQNGGIGESVEVWNQSNGRKYRGVVTDFNKVTVEL